MQVIGAGLPRTATTTQMVALEKLGFAPCYHMRDLLMDLEKGLPLWEKVAEGDADWEQIFGASLSTLDWPSSLYYKELMDYYPEAKILLSVRSESSWARSMQETVWGVYYGHSVLHHLCEARAVLDPLWQRYMNLMRHIAWDDQTGALAGTRTELDLGPAMVKWTEQVIETVPSERLLIWNPVEGWGPLCDFLEVETPGEPLPHLNDTAAFREGLIGGALDIVNDWWDKRERPTQGLHGASLE